MATPQKKTKQEPFNLRWRKYEAMKAAWCRRNPHASPVEYQKAMIQIARLAGV